MDNSINLIEEYLADWINQYPAADTLEQSTNMFSTIEIMHDIYLNTGDESVNQDLIVKHLREAGYKFDAGFWLTR